MLMNNIANMQAVPKEMGPLQFAARSHTHDLGRYSLNASQCGCVAARSEKKSKEKTTPFGVNLMRSQVLYRAAQAAARSYGCTNSHTLATDNYGCACVCIACLRKRHRRSTMPVSHPKSSDYSLWQKLLPKQAISTCSCCSNSSLRSN